MTTTAAWSLGFRPFFLLAGISAVVFIALWGGLIAHGEFPQNYYSPLHWHAHEMLFGYTVAVVSGFLLTAVKNWTGRETASGIKLASLVLVWLLGRLMPFLNNWVDGWFIALVDLVFLPYLILCLATPIWQQRTFRNAPVLLLLLGLFSSNVLFHLDILQFTSMGITRLLHVAIGIILIFIAIIAGRVVPFFIRSACKGTAPLVWPVIEWLSVLSIVAIVVLKAFYNSSSALLLVSVVAVLSNAIRMVAWYSKGVFKHPMLLVLFSGYLWMVLGIGLDALSLLNIGSSQLALHAMTVGSIGVLTLGMMCRVSLGHTGRAIQANWLIVMMFLMINGAVIFRVLFPLFMPMDYVLWLNVSSVFWLLAFLLFSAYFTPFLLARRADGD
ncbi:MAG: NnrS family protein [Cycloclasticus sp.]|nr:NnrS family protein [Cycloclasticus sp.]MBQ0789700.1 NnrS family protein [Cycloclasticus sp.]